MPLTVAKLRALQPAAKSYKVVDSGSLYVLVTTAGSKLWRFNYKLNGKQGTESLGAWPEVSLKDARLARDNFRASLLNGEGRPAKGQVKAAPPVEDRGDSAQTFRVVAEEWLKVNEATWVKDHHARVTSRMHNDAFPALGSKTMVEICPQDVLEMVRSIENRGSIHMSKRVKQHVSAVFRFFNAGAKVGHILADPCAAIDPALKAAPRSKRHNWLLPAEIPTLMQRVREHQDEDVISALAIRFVAHSIIRTKELRLAKWDRLENLNGKEPLLRLRSDETKMKEFDHLVPLSHQAVAILKAARKLSRGEFIFSSPHGDRPMSQNTMIYGIYRAGYHSRATIHGFRFDRGGPLEDQGRDRIDRHPLPKRHQEYVGFDLHCGSGREIGAIQGCV